MDNASRWYPSDAEDADVFTSRVRSPSRAHPYSYVKAACSRPHVLAMAMVAPGFIRSEAVAAGAVATVAQEANMARGILKAMRDEHDAQIADAFCKAAAEAEAHAAEVRAERDAEHAAIDAIIEADTDAIARIAALPAGRPCIKRATERGAGGRLQTTKGEAA